MIERGPQLWSRRDALFVDDDFKSEVNRDVNAPKRTLGFGDEVVDRGHDTVARPALDFGVVHRGVQAAARQEMLVTRSHSLLGVRLTELFRYLLGRVVEIATAVWPADIMENEHR